MASNGKGGMVDEDRTRYELRSAEELHRFEASMMLGQTAVYLLATGAMFGAVADKDTLLIAKIGVGVFGIVVSLAFLLVVYRSSSNLTGARNRADALAESLGFELYNEAHRARKNSILVGRNAAKMICATGCILWIATLICCLFGG